ncbi:BTA121 domain-containing protein surface lipoprotein [Borrelia hermsii]|uniref:BTA121 domain-containing protein surface lipoprotein n=1 Tax=Borrelia hermsii TaxID=140 RepID=UPI0019D702E0|nr:hypothetical protein [Borrelia hermsii]
MKKICNANSLDIIHNIYSSLSSETNNNTYQFKGISNTIKYNKIKKEQFNEDERNALDFIENFIIKLNPDDPDDNTPIAHTKEYFHQFILEKNIVEIKTALANTVLTLNAKKAAEDAIANHNGIGKDKLAQELKTKEKEYTETLKKPCNTSDPHMTYYHLIQTNHTSQFAQIIKYIKDYNKVAEQLNNDEKKALNFLENSISQHNPDDPDKNRFITHTKEKIQQFLLETDIEKIKTALANSVLTLNAKKAAEDSLENYTGADKDDITQRLKDATTNYINHLKCISDVPFSKIYDNFLGESKKNNAAPFKSIANNIKHYNNVKEQLNDNEKNILAFLEDSISQPNPYDPDDNRLTTHSKENFYKFILHISIKKLKESLAIIIPTLNAKKIAQNTLANYTGIAKNTLTQRLEDTTTSYTKYLKNICNTKNFEETHRNFLKKTNNTSQFEKIISAIEHYNNVTKQLDDNEKNALDFLEKSISQPNPDDNTPINHTKENFYKLILNISIDAIKETLAGILLTLSIKKTAKENLEKYNGPTKETLAQRLEDATIQYAKHLKNICNTNNFAEMHSNLSKKTSNSVPFEEIVNIIKHYNNITKQLNDNEKNALNFLEDSITKLNPYDPDDYEITMQTKKHFGDLLLNLSINNLKESLADTILTLNAKKAAEDSLENYTEVGKDKIKQRLADATIQYIKHLKSISNTNNVTEMYCNLASKTNNVSLFEEITNNINYSNKVEQLNDNEKNALNFLEDSISQPNPDVRDDTSLITHTKKHFYKFILNTMTDKFKESLAGIVLTLNAKKAAKDALANYTGTAKTTLAQKLEDATIQYAKHLKNICNTDNFAEMHNNLLNKTNNTPQFEEITTTIKLYNDATEQLNDNEKNALNFLEDSISQPNPDVQDDNSLITHTKEHFYKFILYIHTDKLKESLEGIVLTLNAKKAAKDALANYTGIAPKTTLAQKLEDATTQYIKHLKNICNTENFAEMHNNLLNKTNNSSQFEEITTAIKLYNKVTEQLNEDYKDALTFLKYAITKPNPENPYNYFIIKNTQANFNQLTLYMYIEKFEEALAGIILTLSAKKAAEEALANHTGKVKDIIAQNLDDSETQYVKYLKNICNTENFAEMHNNLLNKTNNSSQFEYIANIIKHYNNITEQLNEDYKNALAFLEDTITKPNPYNPYNPDITMEIKNNFYQFMLEMDTDKLKKALAEIIPTLSAKKVAEVELANYTGIGKDKLEQRFKDATTNYIESLKNYCNSTFVRDIYNNLSSKTNNASQFEEITNTIKLYNNATRQLDYDEKNALHFLEDSISQPNPDGTDEDDNDITTNLQQNLHNFILHTNIKKLKEALSGIVLTLNTKKVTEYVLTDYNWLEKEILIQKFKDATTNYMESLKNYCNETSINAINNALSSKTNNASQFEEILNVIKYYNEFKKGSTYYEKKVLAIIINSLSQHNPDNPGDNKLITLSKENFYSLIKDIKFHSIVRPLIQYGAKTLKAEKVAEKALRTYTGPNKNILTQMLKNEKIQYRQYLKEICFMTGSPPSLYCHKTSNAPSKFENIVKTTKDYNEVTEQLNKGERNALAFLEYATKNPNPDDNNITTNSQQNLHNFILHANIEKFKEALAKIIPILNAKKVAQDALRTYTGPDKDTLAQIFKDEETKCIGDLKKHCNATSVDKMYSNLLLTKQDIYIFEGITNTIKDYYNTYNNPTEQLNNNEENALAFLKYAITKLNPDDHNITTNLQQNLYNFILYTKTNIEILKKALSNIALKLNAINVAKNTLANYTCPAKEILIKMLQDTETNYIGNLKKCCNTTSVDDIYNNLSSKTNNESQFENTVNAINYYNNHYNKIIELLNDDEKDALILFENSIKQPNPDDPDDNKLTTHAKEYFYKLILQVNLYDLKLISRNLIPALNTKKATQEAITNYTGPAKEILTKMLQYTETKYIGDLKRIYTINSLNIAYYWALISNNKTQLQGIIDTVRRLNITIEQLNDDERNVLAFLEYAITKTNPDNPDDYKLTMHPIKNLYGCIQHMKLDRFKEILAEIIPTLNAKKAAEDSLENYTGPDKDALTQRLKNTEKRYIEHLKSIYNTMYIAEIYGNLLRKTNNKSRFEEIISDIKYYNKATEQLNEGERNALVFLEDAITKPNPDDPYDHTLITHSKQNFRNSIQSTSIDKIKKVLSDIAITLNTKKAAEDSLENYTGPDKDTLTQRLKNAEKRYIKHLKSICDTTSIDKMYSNLSRQTNNTSQFVIIAIHIEAYNNNNIYNKITEQLNEDYKNALAFLEDTITKPNPDNPDDHTLITHSKETFNHFILHMGIKKLKATLADIVLTLKTKK